MFPYFKDDSDQEGALFLDRKWRYWPVLSFKKLRLELGYEIQLLRFKGKDFDKPLHVAERVLIFIFNPFKWKIEQSHVYYDGPHCWYQFGPFVYRCSIKWCNKCYE